MGSGNLSARRLMVGSRGRQSVGMGGAEEGSHEEGEGAVGRGKEADQGRSSSSWKGISSNEYCLWAVQKNFSWKLEKR